MPVEPAASELLDRPATGRVFEVRRKVRLGDVDRRGRLRLDAAARYLQDVATDDADDAGLDRRFGWLVRRTLIRTDVPAVLGEWCAVSTWCTGIGRSWAERRTQLRGARGACVDTVSLWVQIDTATGRPASIGDDFTSSYGEACGDRRVSARLGLSARPDPGATERPWWVRRTDLDPFDHVNNAATWALVEDAIDLGDRRGIGVVEYPRPIDPDGPHRLVATDDRLWLFDDGELAATASWSAP